ncbi:MAG: DUF502 domain-containing protein [Gammaproteobacteria bacterium]|nr:DUF502 domain-containing protein [Gammaproteobacteria bacterium]
MNWFWRILLKGLATVLPIFITIYSIYWLAIGSEEFLGNAIKQFILDEYYWPGLGTVVALAFVMLVGVLINNRVGQFFVRKLHYFVTHVPIANTIYNAVLDLMQFFASSREKEGMDQVVEIDIGNNMRVIGFVTQEKLTMPLENNDEQLIGVYLPMSYMIGGFTVYLPREQVKPVDISVEKAMRLTLTAGMTGHHEH